MDETSRRERGAMGPDMSEEEVHSDGFRLSFADRRGILDLEAVRLSPAVTVDRLELVIPELSFPFDISHGIGGLRHRRHLLGRLQLTIAADGLERYILKRLPSDGLVGFHALSFETDHIALLVAYGPPASRVPLTFRLIPFLFEDDIGFHIDMPRAYGPLAVNLMAAVAAAIEAIGGLRPEGREVVVPNPVKTVLLKLLPGRGWRLPDYSLVRLSRIDLLADRVEMSYRHPDLGDATTSSPFESGETDIRRLKREEENHIARHGDRLLTAGHVAKARSAFAKLLNRDPDNPFAVARLAMIDITDPELRETALSLIDALTTAHPQSEDLIAVRLQGAALLGLRDAEIALLGTLHDQGNPMERLAACMRHGQLIEARDPAGAAAIYAEALGARREDPLALFNLLRIRAALGDQDQVANLIPRWLALHQEPMARASAHVVVGELLLKKLHLPALAVGHFERAVIADPANADAAWGLAESLTEKGDLAEAVRQFERLAAHEKRAGHDKGAAEALFRLGVIWRDQGEPSLAVHRLVESLELMPHHPERHLVLAGVFLEMSRWAEAAQTFETALKGGKSTLAASVFGKVALDLAVLYLDRLEDPHAARSWINTAMGMAETETEAKKMLHRLLEKSGAFSSASADFPYPSAVLALSRDLVTVGEMDEAMQVLDRGRKQFPDAVDILDELILRCRETGDRDRLLKRLIERVDTVSSTDRRIAMEIEIGELTLTGSDNPSASLFWFERALSKGESDAARRGIRAAADALTAKAQALVEAGEPEAARMLFEAIEIGGLVDDHRAQLLAEAEAALAQGDVTRAYNAAMAGATGPSEERTRAVMLASQALLAKGEKEAAVRILERMAKSLDQPDAVTLLGAAIEISAKDIEDKEGVRFLLEQYLRENPEQEEVDQAIIKLLAITGERTVLAEYLVRQQGDSLSRERFRHAAELFFSASQFDRAAEVLTRLYRQTDALDDLFLLARALREAGQLERLIELLEERRNEDPRVDAMLRQDLADYATMLKNRILKGEESIPPLYGTSSGDWTDPAAAGAFPIGGSNILDDEDDLEAKLSEAFDKLRLKE